MSPLVSARLCRLPEQEVHQMMSISIIAPNDIHINKCTNRYSITKAGR